MNDIPDIWSCPICKRELRRKILKEADDGAFPGDYDYTETESDVCFLLRIINHLAKEIALDFLPS